ncbi:hypothetical protein M9Y10_004887 [Tritrichomonas musculus]|uniref:CRESS-DNA virus Rep endonuclease domain-containing protein n=1 Tax=Tritrichomonas musculus TaxID=1915356 RepID=A0ABR2JL30_9EUKA
MCQNKWNFKYYIAAVEYAPSTVHKHIHVYIRFGDTSYESSIRYEIPGAHVELANGNEIQNYDYVTKGKGQTFTTGTPGGKLKDKLLKKEYLLTIFSDIKTLSDKDLEEKYPSEVFYHYNKIAEYEINSLHVTLPWAGILREKNIWIFGKSGCGKKFI